MSTDVALLADDGLNALMAAGGANPFTDSADEAGAMANHYLRFNGNEGAWSRSGQEPVEAGTVFAMMIMEAKKGYIGWKNKRPVSEHLVLIRTREPEPKEHELPDLGPKIVDTDGYQRVVRFPVRDLQGGPQMDLTDKADAGWRPIWALIQEYGANARMHLDKATGKPKIPLVEIGVLGFDTKSGVVKYKPTYKITGWMTETELAELIGESEVEEEVDEAAQETAQEAALAAAEAAAAAAKTKPVQTTMAKPKPGIGVRRG
jgi:hypothetical protein